MSHENTFGFQSTGTLEMKDVYLSLLGVKSPSSHGFFVLKTVFYLLFLPPKRTGQKKVRIGFVIHTFALI